MNTKLSFALLIVMIALIVTACTPAVAGSFAPVAAVPPADNQTSGLIPVSGGSTEFTVRSESPATRLWYEYHNAPEVRQESPATRLWYEYHGAPNVKLNINVESACMSVDSQPQRHGGCAE